MKKIKPTLRIVNKKQVKDTPGAIKGQTVRPLCGSKQFPSERIRVGHAKFGPNLHEHLHWHPIYAPAGLAGSHEWQVKDGLELLSIRATTDGHRRMQFTVDRATGVSSIDMHELTRMDAFDFESHY